MGHGGHGHSGGGGGGHHNHGGGGLEYMAVWFFSMMPGAGVALLAFIVLVLNGGF